MTALDAALDVINRSVAASAAVYDEATGRTWAYDGDRWYHAASTIKIAVLACTYSVLQNRQLTPRHCLRVHNRFPSARDGSPYQVPAERDTDQAVHAAIGGSMSIEDLARAMIVLSSNLATNVLLEFAGIDAARAILEQAGMTGIDLVRGVEDERAYEAGLWNRVTARGLVALLRAIKEGRFAGETGAAAMIAILSAQTANRGIPAGLPDEVRPVATVAHKTGEISTVTHDAGIVYVPGRAPYILSVLTGASGDSPARYEPIARISSRAFECLCDGDDV